MITRQAYNKDGFKIPFAIYHGDYVIETNDEIEEIAFYKYSEYPYLSWGTIMSKRDDGIVEIKECGQGYLFKPVIILSSKNGKSLAKELSELTRERSNQLAFIEDSFQRKLEMIMEDYT